MLTVAILVNGNPIMARSAVNRLRKDAYGRTAYECDDGSTIWHRESDGAVPLARALLDTIKEQREIEPARKR